MSDQEVIDFGWDSYINGLGDSSVDIGILTKDGGKNVGKNFTLAELASVLEFGNTRIPSRPYMRQTFDEQAPEIGKFVTKIEDKILEKKIDRELGLEAIGDFHKAEIQKNMTTEGRFIKNAPVTIQRKGSSNELIDTGRLVNSMDIKVNGV